MKTTKFIKAVAISLANDYRKYLNSKSKPRTIRHQWGSTE